MPRLTLRRLRDLVRRLRYAVSVHAAEELEDDDLTILDLESLLLTGAIVVSQRDARTRESKYLVRGRSLDGREAEAVVKVSSLGDLLVLTVYLL